MKIGRLTLFGLLVLSTIAATDVAPSKAELEAMYEKAYQAFDATKYDEALKQLDAIDARKPDLAESQNLRGVILMRQGSYDKAEAALSEALRLDGKFWNARFNLAEIPFLKKDWAEARKRFEELLASNADELKGEATQLIRYKVLLTYLMEGNDKMVDSLLAKFEVSSETPAVQYANTAIALQHQKIEDARSWMATAEKNFSPELNKLFAESLFEIGWLQRQPGQQRAALQLLSPEERVARKGEAVRTKFEQAQMAYEQRNFEGAAALAAEADAAEPNKSATLNLRGEIALEEKKYSEAEEFFNKALKADKNFREAQFNLADIPFRQKEYAKARSRFEALAKQTPAGDKNQAMQLIKFRIFMTQLLEGSDSKAQKTMEQFQFSGDTPALYYAQAAWEFQHGNKDKANDWVSSARKIYPLSANTVYGSSFYELGWLKSTAANMSPAPGAAAVASSGADSAGPAIEPSPIPGADRKADETSPALTLAQAPPPVSPQIAAASGSPAAIIPATSVDTAPPKPAGEATASSAPEPPKNPVVIDGNGAANSASIPTPANTPEAVPAVKSAPALPPPVVAANAPSKEAERSSLGERLDHLTGPKPLLLLLLAGGGIALAAWFFVPRARAGFAGSRSGGLDGPVPLTNNGGSAALGGGPRRVSLQLKGSEPSIRRGVVPVAKRVPVEAAPLLEPAVAANGHAKVTDTPNESAVGDVIEQPIAIAGAIAPEEFAPPVPAMTTETMSAPVSLDTGFAPPFAPVETVASAMPVENLEAATAYPPTKAVAPPAAEIAMPVSAPEETASHEAAAESIFDHQPISEQTPTTEAADFSAPADPADTTPEDLVETVPLTEPLPDSSDLAEDSAAAFAPAAPEVAPVKELQPAVEDDFAAPLDEPIAATAKQPDEEIPAQWSPATLISGLAGATAMAAPTADFQQQPTNTEPMSDTQTPASPVIRTPTSQPGVAAPIPSPGGAPQGQPGGMHTAVQITFSCEIASMQLTPSFKMGSLQLRPVSKVVTMRLAPSQQQQGSPMNLQVNFEVARVQPGPGSLGQMRLNPSQQQKPPSLSSASFSISGLQLMSAQESAPVQLTPQQQGQASVLVTAAFQITTVEFSQSFDIAGIILNSTGRTVLVQLPGTGQGAVESAPAFEIGSVQLGPSGEIAMMQLSPAGVRRA